MFIYLLQPENTPNCSAQHNHSHINIWHHRFHIREREREIEYRIFEFRVMLLPKSSQFLIEERQNHLFHPHKISPSRKRWKSIRKVLLLFRSNFINLFIFLKSLIFICICIYVISFVHKSLNFPLFFSSL